MMAVTSCQYQVAIRICLWHYLKKKWFSRSAGGSEPDVVLVSCAGKGSDQTTGADLQKVVEFKRRGEDILKLSGLGYTIIRPGEHEGPVVIILSVKLGDFCFTPEVHAPALLFATCAPCR